MTGVARRNNYIKPIETRYRDRKFRSRLEARWAVFFTSLGIPFDYEPEGFELPSGRYLPDFWLPEQQCWIEIKPTQSSQRERLLASELAEASGKDVFLFESSLGTERSATGSPEALSYFGSGGGGCGYAWCECSDCGSLGIQFNGRAARLPCKQAYEFVPDGPPPWKPVMIKDGCPRDPYDDKGYNSDSPRLLAAYRKALSARFEFGEEG